MANENVITINDLVEIVTAGNNDYLLISTANGTYKIKASAVGGGGGGASNFEALELTFDNGVISTVKTASEIMALYTSGKCFGGVVALTMPGMTFYIQIQFGMFVLQEGTYVMSAGFNSMEEYTRIEFTASSADSVMTATIGG